jgi:pyruvate dehydrogenase E2 component (dihydrolipoamide acetyltransferase)
LTPLATIERVAANGPACDVWQDKEGGTVKEIILDPALHESLEAGVDATLDEWLVAEGDFVHAGQTLAHANLVHTRLDVPAPHGGVIEEIIVPAGQPFTRGAPLARLIES